MMTNKYKKMTLCIRGCPLTRERRAVGQVRVVKWPWQSRQVRHRNRDHKRRGN